MDPKKALYNALKGCGAVKARTGKHEIWKLPNGKTVTVSVSPSDTNTYVNCLTDLRRALGVKRKAKSHKDFERPARPKKQKRTARQQQEEPRATEPLRSIRSELLSALEGGPLA